MNEKFSSGAENHKQTNKNIFHSKKIVYIYIIIIKYITRLGFSKGFLANHKMYVKFVTCPRVKEV